ncbi:MAG: helix-turn-helix transcriptional regulator [Bacilli bacterium]|nr:helix-turn-helix transcriptional regulator [Bacilli bacterium]
MPKDDRVPFKRLTTAREAADLSQKALADILGVDPVSVNRWEHGDSKPNWDYLRKLSKVLNVSIDYLLENDAVDTFNAEETEIILRAAAILNKKIKKKR